MLDVKDVHAQNDKGLPALRGISLTVRSGEIVGLAGVAGNGQTELSQVITGLRKCDQGQVLLHGSARQQPQHAVWHRARHGLHP